MNSEAEQKADQERIEKACVALGDHFDTVQIFATRMETDGTRTHCHGSGNWFARYGQVRTWLVRQDEISRVQCRKEEEE